MRHITQLVLFFITLNVNSLALGIGLIDYTVISATKIDKVYPADKWCASGMAGHPYECLTADGVRQGATNFRPTGVINWPTDMVMSPSGNMMPNMCGIYVKWYIKGNNGVLYASPLYNNGSKTIVNGYNGLSFGYVDNIYSSQWYPCNDDMFAPSGIVSTLLQASGPYSLRGVSTSATLSAKGSEVCREIGIRSYTNSILASALNCQSASIIIPEYTTCVGQGVTIEHGNLSPSLLNGNISEGTMRIECSKNAAVTVSMIPSTNLVKMDDSLTSKITMKNTSGSWVNTLSNLTVGPTGVAINLRSTLKTSGEVSLGYKLGNTVIHLGYY